MRRRIFVALNLEEGALDSIERLVKELRPKFSAPELGARFVSRDNWHLTVSFLGYQEENDISRIIDAMRRAAENFGEQEIIFKKLLYGPPSRGRSRLRRGEGPQGKTPRMIWLLTDNENSRKLAELKKALEDNLEAAGINFARETRQFSGHLTLARLNFSEKNFGGRARFAPVTAGESGLPPIGRDVAIVSEVRSLDLMESELKRGGAEYVVLQRMPFGGQR